MLTILFLISTMGYIFCLRQYTRLNTYTLPIFVFSAQTLFMHFSGIMGFLQFSIYINFFLGILFFLIWMLNKLIIDKNFSFTKFKKINTF